MCRSADLQMCRCAFTESSSSNLKVCSLHTYVNHFFFFFFFSSPM